MDRQSEQLLREAAKSSSLNGRAIKTNPPPPPSTLIAIEILERWKKKVLKKVFFSLWPSPLPPPLPLLMAGSKRE